MSIGHHPQQAAYTPDMKKENATYEEKQEAKRRIEGSLMPEVVPVQPNPMI
jgi:phosphatidylserine decarboxylase